MVCFLKRSHSSPHSAAATSFPSEPNFFQKILSLLHLFILISYSTLNPLQYGFSPHYSTETVLANFAMTSFLLHVVGVFQPSYLSQHFGPCGSFLLLHPLSCHRLCDILFSWFSFDTFGYFFSPLSGFLFLCPSVMC